MRILTATNIFRSVAEDTYAHTKFSLVYIDDVATDFFTLCVDEVAPAAHRLPEYMSTHDSAGILNPRTSPFAWHNDREGKNFYECLLEWPERLQRFNIAMTTQEAALPVLGMFPFATLPASIDTSDPERAFIVDVAGGRGQSLLQITREIEESGVTGIGRAILEDRERVLDAIPADALPGVEKVPIDFFTPQPIKSNCPLNSSWQYTHICRRTCLLPPPHYAQLARPRSYRNSVAHCRGHGTRFSSSDWRDGST
jgi:hypothetical protein